MKSFLLNVEIVEQISKAEYLLEESVNNTLFVKNGFILNDFDKLSENIKSKIFYIYCKNENEINEVIKASKIPHIIIKSSEDIEWSFKYTQEFHYEYFLYIDSNDKARLKNIVNKIEEKKLPVCFSIGDTLYKSKVNYTEQLGLLKYICKIYNNPLYEKEINLHTSLKDNNEMIKIRGQHISIEKIVLGYFGDEIIYGLTLEESLKKILRSKDCKGCEHSEECISRGIGLIMIKHNINECIGLKLMTPLGTENA